MVAVNIDLVAEHAIEIGANYDVSFQLCGADDLTLYQGACQIKANLADTNFIISPVVTVISKDTFRLTIPFGGYPSTMTAGNYFYDVLFYKVDKRFFAIYGKIQVMKRITEVV